MDKSVKVWGLSYSHQGYIHLLEITVKSITKHYLNKTLHIQMFSIFNIFYFISVEAEFSEVIPKSQKSA